MYTYKYSLNYLYIILLGLRVRDEVIYGNLCRKSVAFIQLGFLRKGVENITVVLVQCFAEPKKKNNFL